MRQDPFEVLGIASDATADVIRAAFRALALEHHPDRNPDDPAAEERFKRVVEAYDRALLDALGITRAPRARPVEEPPPPPIRERFECLACGDTFPFEVECPRCGVAPRDTWTGERAAAPEDDPRVTEMVADLEARGPAPPDGLPPHFPWIAATVLVTAAALAATLGFVPLACALTLYAVFLAALDLHAHVFSPTYAR